MKKILLVEDDTFLVDIYKTKLEDSFSVEVASDGEEAIEKANEETFELILLDIILPKKEGWKVLEEIRRDSKNKNTKVIVISNSEEAVKEEYKDLGVEKCLIKANYTPQETVEEIMNSLDLLPPR